ncbi:MAG: hypothetical protein IPO92_16890, partial [Saprospiraceae bacterium]|nr:hypothetical protein [Saprospiraceae bacterium]
TYLDTVTGFNKMLFKYFTTVLEKNETILKVSNKFSSALTSKEEYENYHLTLQFKYVENTTQSNQNKCGVMVVFCTVVFGKSGVHNNVWMQRK